MGDNGKLTWSNERRKGKTIIFCANCNAAIEKYPSQVTKDNFCSRSCMVEYRNRTGFYKKENHGRWRGGPAKAICERCGKEFEVKNSVLKRNGRHVRFCSLGCRYTRVKKNCEVCGKEFEMKPSHAANKNIGRYCSLECRSVGWKDRGVHLGENNPNYIDGQCRSREYICMKSQERRARKKANGGSYTLREWEDLCAEYGNHCLCCGRNDVILTVDHVIPLVDSGLNDISNIQPLCKSCNSRKHTEHIDYRVTTSI